MKGTFEDLPEGALHGSASSEAAEGHRTGGKSGLEGRWGQRGHSIRSGPSEEGLGSQLGTRQ